MGKKRKRTQSKPSLKEKKKNEIEKEEEEEQPQQEDENEKKNQKEEEEQSQQEEENEKKNQKEEEETEVPKTKQAKLESKSNSTNAPFSMNPAERKLFEIRNRLNAARKNNYTEVNEEIKRNNESSDIARRKNQEEYLKFKEEERKRILDGELDPEKTKLLTTSAAEAQWRDRRKKQDDEKKESFGWELYNLDAQYNAYNKRLKDITFNKEEYEKIKKSIPEEDFYRDAEHPSYGNSSVDPPEKVDKLVNELEKTISKRKNFSRRRIHYEEEYVDYINERNRNFNKKVARAFDAYTTETKQNLERGTAI